MDPAPKTEAELEEWLSRPTAGVVDSLRRNPGDILVLGAGGKMGPTLARMARRALDQLNSSARVIAVSRFAAAGAEQPLRASGVTTIRADLLDRSALEALPDAPNVIFMAGQKFGTSDAPSSTWAMNAIVPALVAERFSSSRSVVFSTGNVYPLTPIDSGGPTEQDPVEPIGEYGASCVARERIFQYAAGRGTPVAIVRLNYAIDLRYGVLVDTARRVLAREPVPLQMGYVNLIWQGDANARALQCLDLTASPATILNLTGAEVVSIRAVATRLGALAGQSPRFEGTEAGDALLSNAARSIQLFGPPSMDLETMLQWTVEWLQRGGAVLGKATKFEEREGRF